MAFDCCFAFGKKFRIVLAVRLGQVEKWSALMALDNVEMEGPKAALW